MAARRNLPIVHPGGPSTSTSAPTSSAGAARIVIPGANANAGPSGAAGPSAAPVQRPTTNSILVNACQKGNPVLNKISSTAWEYADIVPDYQVGATTGVLYLSLRYCRLHPEYIHNRIAKLGTAYLLRIMLVQVDVDDHQDTLKDLTKIAIINNLTIVCAWSSQEASRYLEIYKSFERKGPDLIKERKDNDYMSRMNSLLTEVRGINKTDVITLTSHIGSLKDIVNAPPEELLACPGLGEKKVKRMRESFTGSFIVKKRKSNAERRGEEGPDLN